MNIFEQDRILMPLNVGGNHWTSTIINLEHKRVEYYDSMGGTERQAKEVFDVSLLRSAVANKSECNQISES